MSLIRIIIRISRAYTIPIRVTEYKKTLKYDERCDQSRGMRRIRTKMQWTKLALNSGKPTIGLNDRGKTIINNYTDTCGWEDEPIRWRCAGMSDNKTSVIFNSEIKRQVESSWRDLPRRTGVTTSGVLEMALIEPYIIHNHHVWGRHIYQYK